MGTKTPRMIRREPRASNGWNSGDLDVAFQLFQCGMVWDGNLACKSSRSHLVENGYAVRRNGVQALTGKGIVHLLTSRAAWGYAYRRWRAWKRNPFVATPEEIKRATA